MNRFPRFVSKQIGRFIGANNLFKGDAPVFLPFYHVVSNQKLPHIQNYPYRNVSEFEKELDFFLKYFEPVSLQCLLKNQKYEKRIFHLSFDDGLKESYEVIAPILLKKGIPATFFVNTEFVDNQKLFHKYKASLLLNFLENNNNSETKKLLSNFGIQKENVLKLTYKEEHQINEMAKSLGYKFSEFLKNETPYLSTTQIIELQKKGFTIGAHSLDHPEFWLISEKEQYRQIKESMNWINRSINPEIKAFAFPYTDDGASAGVLKKVKDENICDVTFGTAGVKFDEFDFHFQRYPMEQPGNFKINLKGEYVYFELRKLVGKEIVRH